jgi:hypothetical protein
MVIYPPMTGLTLERVDMNTKSSFSLLKLTIHIILVFKRSGVLIVHPTVMYEKNSLYQLFNIFSGTTPSPNTLLLP